MEGSDSSSENDGARSGGADFESQFGEGLIIDSASDDGGDGDGEMLDGEVYDDGFALTGVGDDVIPTFDLESLVELDTDTVSGADGASQEQKNRTGSTFRVGKVSAKAEQARAEGKLRVGEVKGVSALDELRQVFKTTGGLKLSRDFTERYLFKISADGYHVGWVSEAGNDYDFYNTKHEIVHSAEKADMPQLADPKLLGTGEPSAAALDTIKKAFKIKAEPVFISDTSKGFMYQVKLRDGKQLGWSCKSGRDVEFYDMRGNVLGKVAQKDVPKLSTGPRDVMKEVRRCYGQEKLGVRLKKVGSSRAKFQYKVELQTDKEKQIGWCNISSGYFLFFDKEGKKRLHAISRYEMPKQDNWRGHTKSFGISNELKKTATGTAYDEKGTKPQGIFGLIDTAEIPGNIEDGQKEPKLSADDKKKKKKKKKTKKKKEPRVKTVVKYQMPGLF